MYLLYEFKLKQNTRHNNRKKGRQTLSERGQVDYFIFQNMVDMVVKPNFLINKVG